MMPQTNEKLIYLVVGSIAFLALIGMSAIAFCAVSGGAWDPQFSTALMTITSGLVGALSSLLNNTRTQPAQPADVNVVNPKTDPVPTEPVK